MMKKYFAFFCLFLILLSLPMTISAHSGRTDSQGGHYNHSTGEYHYHHGYSAHQHPNGICPYDLSYSKEKENIQEKIEEMREESKEQEKKRNERAKVFFYVSSIASIILYILLKVIDKRYEESLFHHAVSSLLILSIGTAIATAFWMF